MCVAIVCKQGARLTNAQIENGWSSNYHGGGFAFVKDGKVEIVKGLMTLATMKEKYQEYAEQYSTESPFLVHLRISTSGGVTAANTHPFPIKGGAMIHNGMMFTPSGARAGDYKDRKSDTRVFAEALHDVLELEYLKKAEKRILQAVGSYNKLCFLYDNKDFLILNEGDGFWNDDNTIWFSNRSCNAASRSSYRRGSEV